MFLSKEDFEESIEMMDAFIGIATQKDVKASTAERYARKIFDDFDKMAEGNRQQIVEMIMEDIEENIYNIN